jgi:MarR family transcriptional regulator, organic hydroperoxide resistance regulator
MAADRGRVLIDQLFALDARVRRELRTLCGDNELTDAQLGVLWRLSSQEGGLTSRQLADRLGCDASTVTSLVDRLERNGIVQRQAHPHDRRAKLLLLTPLGCRLQARLETYCRDESPFAALTDKQRAQLHDLFERTR